jgi:hypothetical protein
MTFPAVRQHQLLPLIGQTSPTGVLVNHELVTADRPGSRKALPSPWRVWKGLAFGAWT